MKKVEFEQSIKNKCHEHLFLKDEFHLAINGVGFLNENNLYKIYTINKNLNRVIVAVFNNEDDTYDYLNEIFNYLHFTKINNILDDYFINLKSKENNLDKLIDFYLLHDQEFAQEYNIRKKGHIKIMKRRNYGIQK